MEWIRAMFRSLFHTGNGIDAPKIEDRIHEAANRAEAAIDESNRLGAEMERVTQELDMLLPRGRHR